VLLVEDSVLVLVVMLMIVVELLLTLDEVCHGPITPHPLSISTLNSRTYLARLSRIHHRLPRRSAHPIQAVHYYQSAATGREAVRLAQRMSSPVKPRRTDAKVRVVDDGVVSRVADRLADGRGHGLPQRSSLQDTAEVVGVDIAVAA
jgi:hypothetical protein